MADKAASDAARWARARERSGLAQRAAYDHNRFVTHFLGQLLICGATLSMLLGAFLGLNYAAFTGPWFVFFGSATAALIGGTGLALRREPAPQWLLMAAPPGSAVLITFVMVTDHSDALNGLVLLTWPVLFAGYLLPKKTAWWTLVIVLLCLAAVLGADRKENETANWLELATSLTLTLVVILRLRSEADRLKEALAEQARTDDLTGLDNRRAFTEAMDREYARYRRYRRPLSLLAVDVDHFKQVNDTWGHAAGDTTLRALGGLLARSVRDTDTIGRIGGEEFAVLMPDCGAGQARSRAEALRAAVYEESLAWEHPVTVSIGVATIPDAAMIPEHLLDAADLALYAAKGAGRNRVQAAPRPADDTEQP